MNRGNIMTDTSTNEMVKEKIKINSLVKEPSLYNVVYLNDNVTTFDFVIASLIEIFNFSIEDATVIAKLVHASGSSVVAVMPYEIAEQKVTEVHFFARENQMPLTAKLEPVV